MREWFPLTDYEFYAFVASGMFLIAAVDYCYTGGVLVGRTEWTVVQGVFWTVVAYVLGQICAAPSSAVVEFLLARVWLRSPATVALGIGKRRWREHVVAWLFANREYAPLSSAVQNRIKKAAATKLKVNVDDLDAEAVFQVAFPAARGQEDSAKRLDSFINSYGFCRNICFVAIIATPMLALKYHRDHMTLDLVLLST
ncbi:hypothetical protein P7D22_11345 [Lichenihabitans sp. Uapishka_5]|uniref:hypothetical protein n=1 Tax=Lichenihabitans sp. Uapishka_5 TaxID=3037302 RepID=UPI0029E7E195|nr:hypothetical protein [Lichenihabitans sp. Uapishka_5]MDX7951763.1 hypothetical protein [Lichenihabitans sp. Uapishka_5]